jgi:predicted enzyme related to lactoylglutathione lyase
MQQALFSVTRQQGATLMEVNMHKSRLACIVIDCQTDNIDEATTFWEAALGWPAARPSSPDEIYRKLETPKDQIMVLLQRVTHPSRAHLDIETDNVEAEVARLEKLGARRVAQVKRWWVMEAPTGQRFCVVPPQRSDFETGARVWADE